MEKWPFLQGAIVNEVGMLNCAMDTPDAICIPNGPDQKYPALSQPNHACPSTEELPNGLATFVEQLLSRVSKALTSDGRRAVASFTWFNQNMAGGTYNLQVFNDDGSLNELGESYMSACQAWASGSPMPSPVPTPVPTPSPSPSPTPSPHLCQLRHHHRFRQRQHQHQHQEALALSAMQWLAPIQQECVVGISAALMAQHALQQITVSQDAQWQRLWTAPKLH